MQFPPDPCLECSLNYFPTISITVSMSSLLSLLYMCIFHEWRDTGFMQPQLLYENLDFFVILKYCSGLNV